MIENFVLQRPIVKKEQPDIQGNGTVGKLLSKVPFLPHKKPEPERANTYSCHQYNIVLQYSKNPWLDKLLKLVRPPDENEYQDGYCKQCFSFNRQEAPDGSEFDLGCDGLKRVDGRNLEACVRPLGSGKISVGTLVESMHTNVYFNGQEQKPLRCNPILDLGKK